MTEHQHDLFGTAPATRTPASPPARRLARRENPSTSHAAAETVDRFRGDHHQVILGAMLRHGARGLTPHEVAAFCRLDAHAIGKRTGELVEAGLLRVVHGADGKPETRKSPTGRHARVLAITEKAARYLLGQHKSA